jgi:hypothetical protein
MSHILVDDNSYHTTSSSGDAKILVTTGTSSMYGLVVINTSSSDLYCQVFDATTQPATGTVPKTQLLVYKNSQCSLSKPLPLYRWRFNSGIYVAASTTPLTYTPATGTPFWLEVFSAN